MPEQKVIILTNYKSSLINVPNILSINRQIKISHLLRLLHTKCISGFVRNLVILICSGARVYSEMDKTKMPQKNHDLTDVLCDSVP